MFKHIDMKNILSLLLIMVVTLAFSVTTNAQEIEPLSPSESFTGAGDHEYMRDFGISHWFYYNNVIKGQVDRTNRWQYYEYKYRKEFTIGAIIAGVGGAGLMITEAMPFPVFEEGNDEANAIADKELRNRRIVGYTSGVVLTAGLAVMFQAFKWNGRLRKDMYLNGTSLIYTLPSGKRKYFKGNNSFYLKRSYHKTSRWERKRDKWEKKSNKWFIDQR